MKKKKTLLICSLLAATCFTLHAQDVIIKENGEEIKAKVTEVGATEIKYKKFGNESGPTYTVSKSELFMIKYENGTKEVIEQTQAPAPMPVSAPAPAPVQPAYTQPAPVTQSSSQTTSFSSASSSNSDYKKGVFGLDLGYGSRKMDDVKWGDFLDLGIRVTHNFSPYIGWDIISVKYQALTDDISSFDEALIQGMTGVKGYSPAFYKNMKGYASFKLGYGYQSSLNASGFAYEIELGVYFTRTVFLGFVYNSQSLKGTLDDYDYSYDYNFKCGYTGLRIGFDF